MENTKLDMSVLTATVEIIKAELMSNSSRGSSYLMSGNNRKELLENIEDVYKKLYELENKKEWKKD